jgi:(p)ppGpp synthase/HD superfamily hydrolase
MTLSQRALELLTNNLPTDGVDHAVRVMELRQWDRLGLESEGHIREDETAALLHDVVEDSSVTLDDIENIFGSEIRRIVDLLTRRETETYFQYIDRVATDDVARGIKLADLHDHFAQAGTLTDSLRQRYEKARKILTPASGAHYRSRV